MGGLVEGSGRSAHLFRGFRRLTWVIAVLLSLPGLALALLADDTSMLGLAAVGVLVPWCVFFAAAWLARGFRAPDATRPASPVETQTVQAPEVGERVETGGAHSVGRIVRSWMSSPTHREALFSHALRTKAVFEIDFEPHQVANAMQLTPAEHETFLRAVTWPRMIQVDQYLRADLWPGFGSLWRAFKDDLAPHRAFPSTTAEQE